MRNISFRPFGYFLFVVICLLFPAKAWLQNVEPSSEVMSVLNKAGKNRIELENAIKHFQESGDSLKLKAINFLVANLDIHYSVNYYWADSFGRKLAFDELNYPDFKTASVSLESLKKQKPGIHPVPIVYRDIDSIKSDFLIDNVEKAFEAWRQPQIKNISFQDFCEYVLPYRVSFEPLQNWRSAYYNQFGNWTDDKKGNSYDSLPLHIGQEIKNWFSNTYGVEKREEPLPRLGALQLLFRKSGACEDIADLAALMLRVNGCPSAIDFVPAWATSSGLHYLNYIQVDNHHKHFDAADNFFMDSLGREPGKVVRTTYSRQSYVATSIVDTSLIPDGFMRLSNYRDVTNEYWVTQDISTELFTVKQVQPQIAFISVWNFANWRPIWWSKFETNKAVFTKMSKGVVYLPMYYLNHKLIAASWPIVVGYKTTLTLRPDTVHKRTVHLIEQPGYLAFRTGKKYTLYYWKNGWIKLEIQEAKENAKELVFKDVPYNALLLLIPEYSQGKERPFIISPLGERSWF